MGDASKIEWTDATFNPWIGCTKVSPGCDHCYAEAWDRRFALSGHDMHWGAGKQRRRTSDQNWRLPLRWNATHEAFFAEHGRRRRVFCASLADVFDNEVPPEWRLDLFRLIAATPNLDWLLLTKRIGNAVPMMREVARMCGGGEQPMPNIWLGATVVNQEEADRDIPKLLATPAAVRFLSIEPMLGPVDLRYLQPGDPPTEINALAGTHGVLRPHRGECARVDWVICGGESGPHARPMHPDWARSLRDQCSAAGVPFLFKQWGEHDLSYDRDREDPDYRRCSKLARLPGRWINLAGGHGFNGERVHYAHRIGKKAAGRLLDGRTWDEVPAKERA